ncbi:hypothetical protein [Acrocarpospora sp. B8E8]|uniref:MmyB family transcriptional regulator n=1 Tax=Acrocarpospora sp. B8E8 TaxID=3153572 RepID=UPI00325DEBC9
MGPPPLGLERGEEGLLRLFAGESGAGVEAEGGDRVGGEAEPAYAVEFDAAWTLIAWNRLYAALLGDPSGLRDRERNVLWCHFTEAPTRITHSAEQGARFELAAVADLRAVTARYPLDTALTSLVADLRHISPRFATLWTSHEVGTHVMNTKTISIPTSDHSHSIATS